MRGREVAGEHDAVVDVDLVEVEREVEAVHGRAPRPRSGAWTPRAARSVAPSARAGSLETGKVADLDRLHAPPRFRKLVLVAEKFDCASEGARKPVLAAARTTKPVVELKRAVSLPSAVDAEVAVVLRAAGDAEAQLAAAGRPPRPRRRRCCARLVHLVRRPQAREDLRAGDGQAAELVARAAVDVGVGLAGHDGVALVAVLPAEGEVHRAREAHVERRETSALATSWSAAMLPA